MRWRDSRWILPGLVIVIAIGLGLGLVSGAWPQTPTSPSGPIASATPGQATSAATSAAPSAGSGTPPTMGPTATVRATLSSEPTVAWSQLTPAGLTPVARQGHTWTVDPDSGIAYLFGGLGSADIGTTGPTLGDLWAYDLGADRWEPVPVTGQVPTARWGHGAAWIDGLGLVVVTGRDAAGRTLDDSWRFDPSTSSWQPLPVDGPSIPARSESCPTVDRDGALWMIDGKGSAGEAFADVWRYLPGAGRWVLVDLGPPAQARAGHVCWLDPDGRVRLFGGRADGTVFGDLWRVDLTGSGPGSWNQLPQDGTFEPRSGAAVAIHADRAVILGGLGQGGNVLDSVGIADARDTSIVPVVTTAPGPTGRARATLIDDPAAERMLLFGGLTPSGISSEIWQAVLR